MISDRGEKIIRFPSFNLESQSNGQFAAFGSEFFSLHIQKLDSVVVWTFASATSYSQRPEIVILWTFASVTYFAFRMVYVIAASSLRRTIDKAPTSIRKSIQGKVFAVPGLSFHPKAKNPNRQLKNLLEQVLKSCKKTVL